MSTSVYAVYRHGWNTENQPSKDYPEEMLVCHVSAGSQSEALELAEKEVGCFHNQYLTVSNRGEGLVITSIDVDMDSDDCYLITLRHAGGEWSANGIEASLDWVQAVRVAADDMAEDTGRQVLVPPGIRPSLIKIREQDKAVTA